MYTEVGKGPMISIRHLSIVILFKGVVYMLKLWQTSDICSISELAWRYLSHGRLTMACSMDMKSQTSSIRIIPYTAFVELSKILWDSVNPKNFMYGSSMECLNNLPLIMQNLKALDFDFSSFASVVWEFVKEKILNDGNPPFNNLYTIYCFQFFQDGLLEDDVYYESF